MANSRLEKIGTIYSRTRGLIQSGALKWEDRPLWYDLYEAYPPKEEPRFDRPKPNIPLREIFYEDDKIRAMFHKNNKSIGTINMFNTKTKTISQRFIEVYKKLQSQYDKDQSEEKLYEEAIQLFKREGEHKKNLTEDYGSIASAFKEAQSSDIKVNVKDIFKE